MDSSMIEFDGAASSDYFSPEAKPVNNFTLFLSLFSNKATESQGRA